MNWPALKTELNSPFYEAKTSAEIADAINAKTIIATRPYYASARTLYGLFGPTQGKAIMDAISAADPVLYQIMLQVGDTDGMAGGIDVSLADTQSFMHGLVDQNVITADDVARLIALSQTVTPWRVSMLGQSEPVSVDQIVFARNYTESARPAIGGAA